MNTEMVYVVLSNTMSAEQQKEYATKLIQEYGSFISISDGSMEEALTDGIGYDTGVGIKSGFNPLWALLIAMLVILFQQRRLVPATQTADGAVVANTAKVSSKAIVDAIKKSEATPSEDTFFKIMEKAHQRKHKQ